MIKKLKRKSKKEETNPLSLSTKKATSHEKRRDSSKKSPRKSSINTDAKIEANSPRDGLSNQSRKNKRKYRLSSKNLEHSRLIRCVKASSDFVGGGDGELSDVNIGDDIALRGVPSEGWCEGECKGVIGWFPVSISEELLFELGKEKNKKIILMNGINSDSLIENKESISEAIESKLRKRPKQEELVEKNIIQSSSTSNLKSAQLLKSMEQQKTAAVISNLLSGRSSLKRPIAPIAVNEPSRDSFDDGDTSYTCASEPSEEGGTLEHDAIKLFSTKPNKAINMMIENDLLEDNPVAIADFLYENPQLPGKMVGDYLGENEKRNLLVLEAFLDKLTLTDTEFDQAMRKFLFVFHLPGEAQKIDRIMCAFAKKYFIQNSNSTSPHGSIFRDEDSVYLLAFATIMLNTDLHSMNVKTKMTQDEFVKRTNDGSFPQVFLRDLYQRILEEEIRTKNEKFTHASKRGYLFLEKRVGIRGRKKHIQYWCVLDPESGFLYFFKEKDEVKLNTSFELEFLKICDKQIPTPDKHGLYPLKFEYKQKKPPEVLILVRSQRLWVDWLTVFSDVLGSK